jgi:plastocyanin
MNPSIFCKSGTGLSIYKLLFVTVLLLAPAYAAAATHTVRVLDPRSFSPSNLTIEVGDTVRWVNDPGGNSHDVTADDFSFNSPTASGFEFEMTFNSVAEILYHCSVHSRPASAGGTAQNGRINVVAAVTADVSVDSVDVADGSHKAGENLNVKATLTNSGSGDSGRKSSVGVGPQIQCRRDWRYRIQRG